MRRQIADRIAVHRQLRRAGRWDDGKALVLQFRQHGCADRLDLGDDIVGPVLFRRFAQLFAVEHGEDFARIGQLHGRRIVIGIAGHDIGTQPLGRNDEFAAQLARTEQQDFRGMAHVRVAPRPMTTPA